MINKKTFSSNTYKHNVIIVSGTKGYKLNKHLSDHGFSYLTEVNSMQQFIKQHLKV